MVSQKAYADGRYRSWKQYEGIIKNNTEPTNNSTPGEISSGSSQDRAETKSLSPQLQNSTEQLQLQKRQFPK
jgi:hypothetical protein